MKNIFVLSLILVMLLMIGFSTVAAQTTNKPDTQKIVLKYSILENEEHHQGRGMKKFKDTVEELSGGQITVDIYYNGSLYTQEGTIPALISGALEIGKVSVPPLAEYLPKLGMFAAPYIFRDFNHMRTVLNSEVGQEIAAEVSEVIGFTPLAYNFNGSRQLSFRKDVEVTKPEDLSSTILRVPNSPAWINMGRSLGAKVAPLAYSEVYTALQTGTIDAQDNPLPSIKVMKFYEVTKTISLTGHIVEFGMIVVNNNVWNAMTDQQKEWMREAAKAEERLIDDLVLEKEAVLVDFFKGEGLKIVYPDIDAFSKYSHDYFVKNGLTENWDMNLYNKIQALVK